MDKNSIFELKEKSHSKKTELLIKKRMFDWATELASRELPQDSVQQRELLQHIYKLHGDALYEKKLYDNALSIYILPHACWLRVFRLSLHLNPSASRRVSLAMRVRCAVSFIAIALGLALGCYGTYLSVRGMVAHKQ